MCIRDRYNEAIEYVKKAIEMNPKEKRYQDNLNIMIPYEIN